MGISSYSSVHHTRNALVGPNSDPLMHLPQFIRFLYNVRLLIRKQ